MIPAGDDAVGAPPAALAARGTRSAMRSGHPPGPCRSEGASPAISVSHATMTAA
jgi:hypothetical protein